MSIFSGLSAFPLTPLLDDMVNESAFAGLIERLVDAGVDSVTALGSTGSAAYLSRSERALVARRAVRTAGTTPVFVGISALRTSHVLEHAEDAQEAGVRGLMLAPVSYQPLTPDDVYHLFESVTERSDIPVIVYDNPTTTRFSFDDDLYAAVGALPGIASLKIPGVPAGAEAARARVDRLRALLPAHVTIGVSGDAHAAAGLNAGCDAWYSVIAGTLPTSAVALARAAFSADAEEARRLSSELQPLWDAFSQHGSLRVIAAVAEHLGLVHPRSLPLPILGLDEAARAPLHAVLADLGLDGPDAGTER